MTAGSDFVRLSTIHVLSCAFVFRSPLFRDDPATTSQHLLTVHWPRPLHPADLSALFVS